MRSLRRLLLVAGVFRAVLGAGGDVGGDDPGGGDDPDPAQILERSDKDGDGKISFEEMFAEARAEAAEEAEEAEETEEDMDEAKDTLAKLFKESDADGDGLLGIEEIPVLLKKFAEVMEQHSEDDLRAGKKNDLISAVAGLKPTVVLMQTPGAVLMPWLGSVAAVANLFLAGEETGSAWAPMLFGDTSPQGKLPIQFPETVEDTIPPSPALTFKYSEGLFTSYRNPAMRAAFPFGHGLSYTTFDYGAPRAVRGSDCRAAACLALNVTNAGGRPGTEVAQAYLEFVSAPRTPKRMLRGYHKTRLLQPGESELVTFQFSPRDLSIYSVEAGWVVQDHIRAHVGASSADIRQTLPLPRGGDGERPPEP